MVFLYIYQNINVSSDEDIIGHKFEFNNDEPYYGSYPSLLLKFFMIGVEMALKHNEKEINEKISVEGDSEDDILDCIAIKHDINDVIRWSVKPGNFIFLSDYTGFMLVEPSEGSIGKTTLSIGPYEYKEFLQFRGVPNLLGLIVDDFSVDNFIKRVVSTFKEGVVSPLTDLSVLSNSVSNSFEVSEIPNPIEKIESDNEELPKKHKKKKYPEEDDVDSDISDIKPKRKMKKIRKTKFYD